MVFPFGVIAMESIGPPALIGGPAVFVAVEIGVTHPAPLDGLFATYTVGMPPGVTGAEFVLCARVSAGAMAESAAKAGARATMPDVRRRRRRLMPAGRAFC